MTRVGSQRHRKKIHITYVFSLGFTSRFASIACNGLLLCVSKLKGVTMCIFPYGAVHQWLLDWLWDLYIHLASGHYGLFLGGSKLPGYEDEHSVPSTVEFKNAWS